MLQKSFVLDTPVKQAEFAVREDHTLAVTFPAARGLTLVFRDTIRQGGKRYYLFHEKTQAYACDHTVTIRTAAVEKESGAPIRGLLVTYSFRFDPESRAFHLSVGYNADLRCSGYTLRLMDVSWEGMTVDTITGYERDAQGNPFSHTFRMPEEENPEAPDYETLMKIRPHVAWERMKTRPVTFQKALAVQGKDGYFAICGGTPTFHYEAKYVQVFSEIASFTGDLRYLSGSNSPGAWFLLEKPEDAFAAFAKLEARDLAIPAATLASFPEKEYEIRSGALAFTLLQTRGGIWITPIFAGEKTPCQPWPLVSLDLWDTQYERTMQLDTGTGWDTVDVRQNRNHLRISLSDPENARVRGITLVLEAFLEPDKHRISWNTTLVNKSDRWSVTAITYPSCLAQGYETCFAPVGSGSLIHDFNKRSHTFRGKYPTGVKVNMAYTALYNPQSMEETAINGLYMGIHDPDGTPKFINLTGAALSNCTMLQVDCTPDYQKHPGNSFTLPGRMVWQCFSGDWFDATQIYRSFVFSQAKWLSPLRGRPDTPDWMRNCPVWIMHFMPNENPDANPFPTTLREKYSDENPDDWYRLAVRFREEIGVPVTYHLYNWHWVPFNNDNPHYFPPHHDLKEGMRALKAADIRAIPYIAGYSWDMCDDRGDDYRFQQEALPATAKNPEGDPIYSSYASTEPTGQAVRFARMCPTTTVWKNELSQIVRRLSEDYGMDGIYLDVVSTAYEMCCDESHLHAPGLSSFWWKAYRELIEGLRSVAPEDFAFVSESTSEVYSGMLDGYLSWTWMQTDGVPAHSSIYGGRTAIFGRVITHNKRDDADYFRFQVAQSLVFGQQLGWIHPEIVKDTVQFPFLKKMAAIRWDHREFFTEAQMLRPPVVEGDVPALDCEGWLRAQIWNHEKMVVSGAWEDTCGNRKLFVVNAADRSAEFTLSVYEQEYDLPENIEQFHVCDGFVLLGMESENGIRKLRCRMAPHGVGILNWRK